LIKKNRDIQQRLDIEVICCENDLKQHFLINSDELLIPLRNVGCPLAGLILALVGVGGGKRLATVVFTVLEDLAPRLRLDEH
jgi:hypothetical protein